MIISKLTIKSLHLKWAKIGAISDRVSYFPQYKMKIRNNSKFEQFMNPLLYIHIL